MPYPFQVTNQPTGTPFTEQRYRLDRQEIADAITPENCDDYSADATQMSAIEDHGQDPAPSLATDLAGELKRIRFRLKTLAERFQGGSLSKWYTNITGRLLSEHVDDYSADVAQMSEITNHGDEGSEILATDLPGELKRIRFRLKTLSERFQGGTLNKWYSNITGTLQVPHGGTGASTVTGARDNLAAVGRSGDSVGAEMNIGTLNDYDVAFIRNNIIQAALRSGYFDLPVGSIRFPGSQVASSNPNDLDDYEEGTWTPVVSKSSSPPGVTYIRRYGTYVKIGKLVIADYYIEIDMASGGSGYLILAGIPFLPAHTTQPRQAGIWAFNTALSGGKYLLHLGTENVDSTQPHLKCFLFDYPYNMYYDIIPSGLSRGIFCYLTGS